MEELLSLILGVIFFPVTLLGSWVIVHPQEEKLILIWGKLSRVLKSPGMLFVNICGDAKVQPTYAVQDYDSEPMNEAIHKMVTLLEGIKKQLSAK